MHYGQISKAIQPVPSGVYLLLAIAISNELVNYIGWDEFKAGTD